MISLHWPKNTPAFNSNAHLKLVQRALHCGMHHAVEFTSCFKEGGFLSVYISVFPVTVGRGMRWSYRPYPNPTQTSYGQMIQVDSNTRFLSQSLPSSNYHRHLLPDNLENMTSTIVMHADRFLADRSAPLSSLDVNKSFAQLRFVRFISALVLIQL